MCVVFFLTEHSYEYLVEGQPIGWELFHQFCDKHLMLSRCIKFLKELTDLELAPDEKYGASSHRVFSQFLAEGVSMCIMEGARVCTVHNTHSCFCGVQCECGWCGCLCAGAIANGE